MSDGLSKKDKVESLLVVGITIIFLTVLAYGLTGCTTVKSIDKFNLPKVTIDDSEIPELDKIVLSSEKTKALNENIPAAVYIQEGEILNVKYNGFFVSEQGMMKISDRADETKADILRLKSRIKATKEIADKELTSCKGVLATYKSSAEFAVQTLKDEVDRLNNTPGFYLGYGLGALTMFGGAAAFDIIQ